MQAIQIYHRLSKLSHFLKWFKFYWQEQGKRISLLTILLSLMFAGLAIALYTFVAINTLIATVLFVSTITLFVFIQGLRPYFQMGIELTPLDQFKIQSYMAGVLSCATMVILSVFLYLQEEKLIELRNAISSMKSPLKSDKPANAKIKTAKADLSYDDNMEKLGIMPLNGGKTNNTINKYEYGENKDVNRTLDYIKRFASVAKTEQKKFGIPTSITLAQGILESRSGTSKLCKASNNHFGIKTWSKSVKHVVYHDDAPTDKFKVYESAWDSYRDHSLFLMKPNYKNCQALAANDYKGWAKGLKESNYATEKNYHLDLIAVIEKYQLYKFDL